MIFSRSSSLPRSSGVSVSYSWTHTKTLEWVSGFNPSESISGLRYPRQYSGPLWISDLNGFTCQDSSSVLCQTGTGTHIKLYAGVIIHGSLFEKTRVKSRLFSKTVSVMVVLFSLHICLFPWIIVTVVLKYGTFATRFTSRNRE